MAGTNLEELIRLVKSVKPALVLLAGDLVDDKFITKEQRRSYWSQLKEFFEFLEDSRVKTFFVKGNRDNQPQYEELASRKSAYVEEISDRRVEYKQISVLGVSHAFTDQLKTMKAIRSLYPEPLDIVLAHAEYRRRIWLFELPAKVIITGHFDEQFCLIQDKTFLSFYNFPLHHAVIDYQLEKFNVTYFKHPADETFGDPTSELMYTAQVANGRARWQPESEARWRQYARQMESLLLARENFEKLEEGEKKQRIGELLKLGVFKSHIAEYLPGANSLLTKQDLHSS
jgi:predicted phosphodiesterase